MCCIVNAGVNKIRAEKSVCVQRAFRNFFIECVHPDSAGIAIFAEHSTPPIRMIIIPDHERSHVRVHVLEIWNEATGISKTVYGSNCRCGVVWSGASAVSLRLPRQS